MAILNSFEAACLRLLEQKIKEIITANAEALVFGNAYVLGDVDATTQNYTSTINYVRGLNDALKFAREAEDELLGLNEKASDQNAA